MLIAFKDEKDGFYQVEVKDGEALPSWTSGLIRLSDDEAEALRQKPDAEAVREAKLAAIRTVRESILNRLTGIERAASLTGDAATSAAYLVVRQGLLDITNGLKDLAPELIDGTVMQRYALLVQQCTPAMVSAFAQVDA